LYPIAILTLATNVHLSTQTRLYFICRGLVLGAAAYGTCNLTNYAFIVGWPISITIQDWLWGTFLTSICAWIGGHVWLKLSIVTKKTDNLAI
jgi:uncharacterized membrane protein